MRYTVLSYIFGGYDIVHEILEKDSNADYILVTDDKTLKSDTWHIVYDPMDDKSILEKCYYVRYNPFIYANTKYVIRLDSSILIKRSLAPFIDKMESDFYDRCLMIHPRRNLLQDEYSAWVKGRGYSTFQAKMCLDYIIGMGYDLRYKGLFQACFEVVQDNDINARINEQTFTILRNVLQEGSVERIDQTILSFVINFFFSNKIHILPISQDVVTNGLFMDWFEHKSFHKRTCGVSIKPMLFSKECSTWTPIL